MISVETVKGAIDNAERDFQKCWEILATMKCGPISSEFGEQFLTFQPILGLALFRLDEFYLSVQNEKRTTIANKRKTDPAWFTARMREFDGFRASIESALVVGRSLGDAFAWFFYRKSQTRITPHLRHRPITHIPTGVGGQAELAFLSRIRDAGYVVIYHGITSFLRIGDLSFLDLRSGEVVALGELKARKVKSGEMEVTLHMIGTDRNRVPFSSADVVLSSSRLEDPEVPKDFVQRLERQICETRGALNMSEASQPSMTPADNSEPSSVYDAHEVGALKSLADTLEKSDVAYEQAGSGLLLVRLNVLPERSLSERLFGANRFYRSAQGDC